MTTTAVQPPGPQGRLGSNLWRLRRNRLFFLTSLAAYGDVAQLRLGSQPVYLVSHPDLVKEVLVTQGKSFMKGQALQEAKRLLGEGLLTSEGEVHLRQRVADGSPIVSGGESILCAARVEPHVEPGQIWATEEFRQQLSQTPSLWRTTPVPGPTGADGFNVKKDGGTEPDLWVRLYRLEF